MTFALNRTCSIDNQEGALLEGLYIPIISKLQAINLSILCRQNKGLANSGVVATRSHLRIKPIHPYLRYGYKYSFAPRLVMMIVMTV